MVRRRGLIHGVICAASLMVIACQRPDARIIEEDNVEFRAGPREQNLVERLDYRFDRGTALSLFDEWARARGYALDRALYEVGYLGPPPDECSTACDVYMLHIPGSSSRPFVENYLVYVANDQVIRIDNAFQYPP